MNPTFYQTPISEHVPHLLIYFTSKQFKHAQNLGRRKELKLQQKHMLQAQLVIQRIKTRSLNMTMERNCSTHKILSKIKTKSTFHVQNAGHDINVLILLIINIPCKVY